ncbi:MAG TPA: protein kinase [Gammaproteobacteria bacterium]|nr:protein kinase [Gammaproteobacteria bacterium]
MKEAKQTGDHSTRKRVAGFEAAVRAYLRHQLDFSALRQELEDVLYADLACAPLTLELLASLYAKGTLAPQPYTALKDDVEKTLAEEGGRTEVLSNGAADMTAPVSLPAADFAPPRPGPAMDRTLPIRRVAPGAAPPRAAAKRERPAAGEAAPRGNPAPVAEPFEPGHVLRNRFVLQSRIGQGGMGIVYRALDRRKQEAHDGNPYVALKILRHEFRQRPDSLSSLQQEALKAQRLSHPNIVNVFDFDRDGDAVFMTMELLEGESLARLLNRMHPRRLPREQAMAIIAGMARGLAYAHEHGIIHYDFKPGNVVLTHDGKIKLLDFGIARAAPEDTLYTFGAGPQNAMTPAYASCEMLQDGEPDPRDDIYGLACVSYELLAGRHPFNRQSAVRARQQNLKPPRLKGLKRTQWKALERGLRFARNERTPSAGQFLLDIQGGAAVTPETEVAYTGLVKRPVPAPRRGRRTFGVLALGIVVAALVYFSEAALDWFDAGRDGAPGELAPSREAATGPPSAGDETQLETIAPVPDPTIATADVAEPDAAAPADTPAEPVTSDSEGEATEPAAGAVPVDGVPVETSPAALPAEPEPAAAEQPADPTAAESAPAADAAATTEPAPVAAPGRLGFERRDYRIRESASVVVLDVVRQGGTSGEVAVAFATEDGTASADRDYGRFELSIITFAEGEDRRQLFIPIVSDTLVEEDETFYVVLSNPSGGAQLGEFTTATVTIVDDDF